MLLLQPHLGKSLTVDMLLQDKTSCSVGFWAVRLRRNGRDTNLIIVRDKKTYIVAPKGQATVLSKLTDLTSTVRYINTLAGEPT